MPKYRIVEVYESIYDEVIEAETPELARRRFDQWQQWDDMYAMEGDLIRESCEEVGE